MNNDSLIRRTQTFFFYAMRRGYVSERKVRKKDVPGKPGFRQIVVVRGDFRLVDEYSRYLGTARRACGSITIWHEDQHIWTMSFSGWYRKPVLPHVRQALRMAYSQKLFLGGRGPSTFFADGLDYRNVVEFGNFFREFRGYEDVKSKDAFMGSLRYNGHPLI